MTARNLAAVRGWERRRENDERAIVNMASDHVALWHRVKGAAPRGTPHARAEWLAEYAEEHPAEVVQALDEQSDATLARRLAERNRADLALLAPPASRRAPTPHKPTARKPTAAPVQPTANLAATVERLTRRVAKLERERRRAPRSARPPRAVRYRPAPWLAPNYYVVGVR